MRATSKKLRLPAEERLELAWRTLFWSVYHRMYIVAVDGYILDQNFQSDKCNHDALLRCSRVVCTLTDRTGVD